MEAEVEAEAEAEAEAWLCRRGRPTDTTEQSLNTPVFESTGM